MHLASVGVHVHIEHTVDGQNRFFFNISDLIVMPAETWATTKVKIAKLYAFVYRNLLVHVYTEN